MIFNKNKNQNFNELLKGSSISLFLKVLGMLFGYSSMLFVTNYYGADEWGIYSLCFTILSISVLLPKFGFDNSLVRIITSLKINNNHDEIKRVVFKSLMIAIIISFIIIIFINLISDFIVNDILRKQEIKPYIIIVTFSIIPLVTLSIVSAFFQAIKKTAKFILFQTTLINILFLFLLIICYWQEKDVAVFKLYFIAICLSSLIAMFFLLYGFKDLDIQPLVKKIEYYNYKKIINISTPMLLSSSFALLMGWSDILMLSYFKSTTDIGIYDSTLKLSILSGIPLIAINAIATPKFVEYYTKNDIEGLKDTVKQSTKMIFLAATPVLLVLIIFSKVILGFFGEEFIVGYLALIYLCISRFINAISGSVGYIMQMTDQQRTYQNVIVIAFLINLFLNFILIPNFSYNGAAIASSVAMIFWNVTLVVIIKKKFGFWTFITFNFKRS